MFRNQVFILLLMTCASPMLGVSGVLAQTFTSSATQAETGLKTTEQVLNQVCDFFKAQKSFTYEMDITYEDVLDSGSKVQYSAYQKTWVEKPNRMRSDYVGDQRVTRFYYDGQNFSLFAPDLDYYATKAAPESLDAVLDKIDQKFGITIPMSNLVASDPCADMKADVRSMIFVGSNMVNRIPMYQILMQGQERDYQIWVTRDPQPLLKKAIITYKTLPGSPQYTAVFSNWNFNPNTPAETFTFSPPIGAKKIEFLPTQVLPASVTGGAPQNNVAAPTEPLPANGTNNLPQQW
jgi:hypothetical protein